ncbi:putative toxin-antitoxin system toxin component, PIN family [Endothiovibrio diazotrophicus]
MTSARFVVDTNILISVALAADSVPAMAFERVIQLGAVVYSEATFKEFCQTLNKPKLAKRIGDLSRTFLIDLFIEEFVQIHPTETVTDCRDPKDNKFLELAVAGGASALITGDQDLLALHPFRGIPILTPADFLAQYPD